MNYERYFIEKNKYNISSSQEPKAQASVQRRTNWKASDDGKGNLSERSELMLTYRRKKLEIWDYARLVPPKNLLVDGALKLAEADSKSYPQL